MVTLRIGAVAGLTIAVIGILGWFANPPGVTEEGKAFEAVAPPAPNLTHAAPTPPAASVATTHKKNLTPEIPPRAIAIPDAAQSLPTLTAVPGPAVVAKPALVDPPIDEAAVERILLAQYLDGDTKQACTVDFETIPAIDGGVAVVEAGRQLEITDTSGATSVVTRTWRILDDEGVELPPGETATFNWENGSTLNPRPLPGSFGPAVGLVLDEAGSFTVQLTIVTSTGTCTGNLAITVIECVDPPSASFDAVDSMGDLNNFSLLPLQDWMPLFQVLLTAEEGDAGIAQRALGQLNFRVGVGPVFPPDVEYDVFGGPRLNDILEFGLFADFGEDGAPDGVLNIYDFGPILTWANDGYPYDTSAPNDLFFTLDFFQGGDGASGMIEDYYDEVNDRLIPAINNFNSPWPVSGPDTGRGYIVVFRTSASWRSGTSLSYGGVSGFMIDQTNVFDDFDVTEYFVNVGCGEEAEPVDTYPDEALSAEDTQYSSLFNDFDMTGDYTFDPETIVYNEWQHYNLWNWTNRLYTPLGEHVRPRFDGVSQTFDMVTGEWMDLRSVFSLETWYPVVGLNIHGGASDAEFFGGIQEINMVFTDIGGDPDDPNQGNGGFDPREGFDDMTIDGGGGGSGGAWNRSYAFNGVWVYHDTNGNGAFDAPEKSAGGGVTFTDHPMLPNFFDANAGGLVDPYENAWSYIPNPAWGGDPAWKIRLRLDGDRRRAAGEEPTGYIEPVPDADPPEADPNVFEDYFVVIRADSGYEDVSGQPGDGTGLEPAADFRAFVEPRNFNSDLRWWPTEAQIGPPIVGGWDGGIFTTLQRGSSGTVYAPNVIGDPWQQDPLNNWPFTDTNSHYHSDSPISTAGNNPEPWWPQRTLNWNNAKPQRGMVQVHDLVMLYDTNSQLAKTTNVDYAAGSSYSIMLGFTSFPGEDFPPRTNFDSWMDPFHEIQNTFYNRHSVGVIKGSVIVLQGINGVSISTDDNYLDYQYSFETLPFFDSIFDVPPFGPRSSFYTPPLQQPTLPEYDTWPPAQNPADQLPPGDYPQLSDWPQAQRAARFLKQHTDVLSPPVPMLGLNLVGADDPVTNRVAQTRLEEVTVAFWGPDFTPSDLLPLDRAGEDEDTGVLLYQDAPGGGYLFGGVFDSTFGGDTPVPLNNLAWRNVPESVDIDGDGVADDIDGDGTVDASDYCWVLRLRPRQAWTPPLSDMFDGATFAEGNLGDDLYVVVRTSESIRRFENFRVIIPSTLPSRTLSEKVGGIKLAPNQAIPAEGNVKRSPEENAVQDWFGHDMLESNVPVAVTDLTVEDATISPIDEEPTAVIGIDVSTNRPYSEAQPFNSAGLGEGTRGSGSMTVTGNPFTAGALIGDYVIDSTYEPFEITGNTANTITFLSGTPAPGAWIIAREPSFLEQIIVEFYDEGNDGGFNLNEDLLLLNEEDMSVDPPVLSGVAIYRDNDFHPDNTDGVFDPDIDFPLDLDDAPVRIGVQGEPQQQVKFVFSSPGTDDLPVARAQQPRLRQWVPDSWNEEDTTEQSIPGASPDFFVVIRASSRMQIGDDFRVGLVSWGPNTPTEPDPDTFTFPAPPAQPQDEFDIFSEFAWGARALGFITQFKTQPFYYFWERTRDQNETSQRIRAAQQQDISGVNWVRSSANKALQTGIISASTDGVNILITDVNPTELPRVVEGGGLVMQIDGRGFGGSPRVEIAGLEITPDSASDNSITITIPEGTTFDFPIVLTVENTETGEIATWTDFTLIGGGGLFITSVTPSSLPRIVSEGGIVLTIAGFGFGTSPVVTLGDRTLQVQTATDELITVLLPAGLDLSTLELVLTVTNPTTNESDTYTAFTLVDIQLLTASPNVIPPFPPPSGINVRLGGTGFGENPIVTMNGFTQTVISATDTEIVVSVTQLGAVVPGEFITVTVTNTELNVTATRDDLIRVGDLPAEDAPTATLEVTDGIAAAGKDGHALVPLSDWAPLFHISMTFDGEEFAPRVLSKLRYAITFDNADERDWGRVAAPEVSDILEFALFHNFGAEGDDFGSLDRLDSGFDSIVIGSNGEPAVWDNEGQPLGRLISDSQGALVYEIDFIGTGTPADPQFPVTAGTDPTQYIVAVRTSATWRSMIAMGFSVLSAEMVDPDGNFPRDAEGAPTDSYTPDFYGEGETLDSEGGYSSSFAVWDVTGYTYGEWNPSFFNSWNWPQHQYTPSAEQIRPRWDMPGSFADFVSGEWLNLRNVFSLESWNAAVGINLHATQTVHVSDPLRTSPHLFQNANFTPEYARLQEVNVIVTDIGADPNGTPGNGGFDPRIHLDPLTPFESGPIDDNVAIGRDLSFNGVQVWQDTNNNGMFDPPTMVTPDQFGGITFNGDWPMASLSYDALSWEYIPFPPTGGDPWWKLKIQMYGLRREGEAHDENFIEGSVEPVPDNEYTPFTNQKTTSDYAMDYFVVFRADSGFQDASREPGDGTSMRPGADFRTFIEPRRFNPVTGNTTGGIYVDSMIPGIGYDFAGFAGEVWQNDVRWGEDEPWWPQRTSNHNSAMPVRATFDVHDLVMSYDSSSENRMVTGIQLAGIESDGVCFGYAESPNGGTLFDLWMDPFGLLQSQFLNQHAVTVPDDGHGFFRLDTIPTDDGDVITIIYNTDDPASFRHYPYETVPFFHEELDGPQNGPRAPQFPNPPAAPSLPEYATWEAHSEANVYPRASDWDQADRGARILKQHVDTSSEPTAMLGFNFAGVDDPVANRLGQLKLSTITIAFWGPDFDPTDLEPLDRQGVDPDSGVMLWEDSNQSGVYEGRMFESFFTAAATLDSAVTVTDLAWAPRAELIDMTGDGIADDMNGDGVVDDRDKAWVLTLQPQQLWPLPDQDINDFGGIDRWETCSLFTLDDLKDNGNSVEVPYAPKDLGRDDNNSGDDLFVSVRTSKLMSRFEQFRAVVPATLPERAAGQRQAGIQFSPVLNAAPDAYAKLQPEEGVVQEFYGHDMLESNVPMEILDLTQGSQTVSNNGGVVPVMGLDISTSREDGTLAEGASGVGGLRAFTVTGATWGPGTFVGHFLIDSKYESFEITGNTANRLDLLSGAPAEGRWRIVKDPTFLEQLIIEIYNESAAEGGDTDFNIATDLLPIVQDMSVSGIAIYRDNDSHPNNRNGQFDPGIDMPIKLDGPPQSIATPTGPENQFLFVFSSPGTDNVPKAKEEQLRFRQWVPDTFGLTASSEFTGADFFIVVRASNSIDAGDDFRVAIVGWGPNTPTFPDPDTFLPGNNANIMKEFDEFPWGSRAVGFVTMLSQPQTNYYLEGTLARAEADASGFDFIRSGTSKKRRTFPILGRKPPVGPNTITIDSVSEDELPQAILPGESFSLVIYGNNFGTEPQVSIGGYDVTVDQATDETINVSLRSIDGVVPKEPVVLIVSNLVTKETANRSDLFTLRGSAGNAPRITSLSPTHGGSTAFPVTIRGSNFQSTPYVEVLFGTVKMDIVSATPTAIVVSYPRGGFPDTGPLDVTVRNLTVNYSTAGQHILVGGFTYENDPQSGFGCSGAGTGAGSKGDIALLGLALALCLMVLPRRKYMA